MSTQTKKIFMIGGLGAQGLPIIHSLISDPNSPYSIRILTRNPNSPRAKSLLSSTPQNSKIELITGSFTSETDIRNGLSGCWGAFINIDGFACGEALEIFYTMRCYELAIEAGVEMYIHGNIDFGYKVSGYRSEFRCGHYDGKGRVGEWILMSRLAQKMGRGGGYFADAPAGENHNTLLEGGVVGGGVTVNRAMKAALFTTGPYIDMTLSPFTPMAPTVEKDEETGEEILTWRVPLGENGAIPHVALDDCGHYLKWLFDNYEQADGMDLRVGMDHVRYEDMARAFEKVTGKRARFVDVTEEEYWHPDGYWGKVGSRPCGYIHAAVDGSETATSPDGVMTIKENFTGWWRMWQNCGQPGALLKRDYRLLDEIHPGRIRTAEDFFLREDAKARKGGKASLWDVVARDPKVVLKIHEDQEIQKYV